MSKFLKEEMSLSETILKEWNDEFPNTEDKGFSNDYESYISEEELVGIDSKSHEDGGTGFLGERKEIKIILQKLLESIEKEK